MIKSYVYTLLAVFLDYNKDLAYIYYLSNHTMFAFRNDNIYHKYKVAIKLFYTIFNCFPINCKQNDLQIYKSQVLPSIVNLWQDYDHLAIIEKGLTLMRMSHQRRLNSQLCSFGNKGPLDNGLMCNLQMEKILLNYMTCCCLYYNTCMIFVFFLE